MSRPLAALVALVLVAGAGIAHGQQAAPAVHPATKLNFAQTLGAAQFERSASYPIGREAAYTYLYAANKMAVSVSVYDGGRRVPSGSDNASVVAQFTEQIQSTDRAFRTSGFANVDRPSVPSICSYGGVSFRCTVYSVSGQAGRMSSKLMLTGYRDHYVKIRIDWSLTDGRTVADADQVLQGFVGALLR